MYRVLFSRTLWTNNKSVVRRQLEDETRSVTCPRVLCRGSGPRVVGFRDVRPDGSQFLVLRGFL